MTNIEDINWDQIFDLLDREPDRTVAIVASALLEELVERLLLAFLVDIDVAGKLLHGFSAPVGTFSSQSDLAYSLGLISQHEHEDLAIVRRIRNAFAHSFLDIDFSNQSLRDSVGNLNSTNVLSKYSDMLKSANQRSRFVVAAVSLSHQLALRIIDTDKIRRQPRLNTKVAWHVGDVHDKGEK